MVTTHVKSVCGEQSVEVKLITREPLTKEQEFELNHRCIQILMKLATPDEDTNDAAE